MPLKMVLYVSYNRSALGKVVTVIVVTKLRNVTLCHLGTCSSYMLSRHILELTAVYFSASSQLLISEALVTEADTLAIPLITLSTFIHLLVFLMFTLS